MSILFELTSRFRQALAGLVDDPEPLLEMVRRSQDPRFGDYQANAAMGLAKRLNRKPRDDAQQIVDALAADADFNAMYQPPEIAGPGFINLRLSE